MWRRSREVPAGDLAALLHELATPGCLLCGAAERALSSFYFWYLNEQYHEPPVVTRVQSAHGFCRRHTLHLLVRAGAGTVTSIYRLAVPAWAELARRLEAGSGRRDGEGPALAARARPSAACPACEQEGRTLERTLRGLHRAVADPETAARVVRSRAICLTHLLAAAPSLSWTGLRTLTEAALHGLGEGGVEGLWGTDGDAAVRVRAGGARSEPASGPGPEARSTSLADLHRLLGGAACPLCSAGLTSVDRYLRWLEREVFEPAHRWSEATVLCPVHAHDLASRAAPASIAALAAAARSEWTARLRELHAGLERRPPESPFVRLLDLPEQLRRTGDGGRSGWRRWRPALAAVLEPPERRLGRLRDRALNRPPCPACRHAAAAVERWSQLLAAALDDPGTARRYARSHGVCLRHLPAVLGRCRGSSAAGLLLRSMRVRLELLAWELEEAQRKAGWDLRHEPAGGERTAWRRAASLASGAVLEPGLPVGLSS